MTDNLALIGFITDDFPGDGQCQSNRFHFHALHVPPPDADQPLDRLFEGNRCRIDFFLLRGHR
jgi:hypothetical protein